jgi:hypothetical protein
VELAAIRSTLHGVGRRRIRSARRWPVAVVRCGLMNAGAATWVRIVISGISGIPVGIGTVISAANGGFTRRLMNSWAASWVRIVITGISGGVIRIRRVISTRVHRAGRRRVGCTPTAGIGVVNAGIAGVMFRVRSVVSRRIDGSTCAYGRHGSGSSKFTRPSSGSHSRHAMVDVGEL